MFPRRLRKLFFRLLQLSAQAIVLPNIFFQILVEFRDPGAQVLELRFFLGLLSFRIGGLQIREWQAQRHEQQYRTTGGLETAIPGCDNDWTLGRPLPRSCLAPLRAPGPAFLLLT